MEDLLGDGTERVIGMSLWRKFRSTGARRASLLNGYVSTFLRIGVTRKLL